MSMHNVTTVTSQIPTFEALHAKMQPHFKFFARRVLRLKKDNLDDALQELTLLAYALYLKLVQKGKAIYYTPLLRYSILHYKDGRRFIGTTSTDVMSEQTKIRGRSKLVKDDTLYLMTDRKVDVARSAHFKVDFDAWYHTQSSKDKSIIDDLANGELPSYIAKKLGQSPASITNRRHWYEKQWNDYIADKYEGGVA